MALRFPPHSKSWRQISRLPLAALLVASSLHAAPALLSTNDPSLSVMREVIERSVTDENALERLYRLSVSDKRTERLRRYHVDQSQRLEAVNFDALDQDGRIDYLLLKTRLRHQLRELEHDARRTTEIAPLIPFASALVELDDRRRQREPGDPKRDARALTGVTEQIARTRKELEARLGDDKKTNGVPLPSKVVANRAARAVDELREMLKRWNEFHSGYDPDFTWWVSQPFQKTEKELKDYASFLRKKLAGFSEGDESDAPIIGDPIGRQALLDALESEMIPYTPEELIDIANQEFAWCEKEQRRAATDLGFDGDWKKALDHVSNLHVKPGAQPQLIKQLSDESVKFLEERDLVTIPPLAQEIWRTEMMTPERQKVNPYFTGGEVISISFPTDTMSHEDKLMSMRGNNIHFSRATVHHELIPGHHLQGFMAARYRTHRRAFSTPFLVEGWALYWEMLLWDLNFPRSAEDRVGMLFWRSHRCARIIFSLRFHLGQMTPQECIDFLVERVGHERRNATAEVRRSVVGGYGPLYQAAYMLGGLQLRALHKEVVGASKMTNRQFHDAVLKENSIPIEMIRASLIQQPLTRRHVPEWRFYGAVR